MKLEWFRKHKKFVYWVLLPVVGGSMAFFGLTNALSSKGISSGTGTDILIKVGNRTKYLPPSDVFSLRLLLARYSLSNGNVSSDEAARHAIQSEMAQAAGFEMGEEELKHELREAVKEQVQRRDRDENVQVSDTVYRKLLDTMAITPAQFTRLTRDFGIQDRYLKTMLAAKADDAQLYVKYMKDKETVRLRYTEIKSEDFMGAAATPTEEQIKAFHTANSTEKGSQQYKDIMMTEPKMSAEVFFYNPAKMLSELKPSEAELKQRYEREKLKSYQVPLKPGETPPPPGKEQFKPFEEVKAAIEAQWRDDQKFSKPKDKAYALKADLDKELKKHADAQAKLPEKDRKEFDMAAWAKSNDLVYWVTSEQTEAQYKKGKKEAGAADAAFVASLFRIAAPMPAFDTSRMPPAQIKMYEEYFQQAAERRKQELADFKTPEALDAATPEKGFVFFRKKTYTPSAVKPLADAKAAIAEHLKIASAIELAQKKAAQIQAEWAEGKNLPPVESLEEAVADSKSSLALARKFFAAPKAVGVVLDTASDDAPANAASGKPSEHKRFQTGFAVERQRPGFKQFQIDTAWNRDDQRKQIAGSEQRALSVLLMRQIQGDAKLNREKADPPLFESFSRGHSGDGGDDGGI